MSILPGAAHAEAPSFTNGGEYSSDTGHVLLSWEADQRVTLSIAQDPDMSDARTLYSGTQTSYFLSGLSDGEYRLHLEGENGEVSEPAILTVAHQSLAQALWLTLIGLIITAGIIATIVRGARDD